MVQSMLEAPTGASPRAASAAMGDGKPPGLWRLSGSGLKVYLCLLRPRAAGGGSPASVRALSRAAGVSRQAVITALGELERTGVSATGPTGWQADPALLTGLLEPHAPALARRALQPGRLTPPSQLDGHPAAVHTQAGPGDRCLRTEEVLSSIGADVFIVATGRSDRQVRAIAEAPTREEAEQLCAEAGRVIMADVPS